MGHWLQLTGPGQKTPPTVMRVKVNTQISNEIMGVAKLWREKEINGAAFEHRMKRK